MGYNPLEIEEKWYNKSLENNHFESQPNDKEPYTIVIPPPNVTGVLHMGHIMNNTIQDILTRRARMLGKNALWVPGTDHAAIATEAKVVAKLKAEGINKKDISREEFINHCWDWTDTHGGIIINQLKKLGCSCDWNRLKFTLEDSMSEQVISVFVQLFNKGLIYRDYKMVNWDPEAKTTLSDEEVNHIEQDGKLYYIKYKFVENEEYFVVATTRPETIFGDTAICVHPEDERYKHLIGKEIIVPICNRKIPIIADDYITMEFGTGCLKVTPAHDINDYELGKRHNLQTIDCFNNDGTLNANGLHYQDKDRFVVRKEIEKELSQLNLLDKIEDYKNKVGTSERTNCVIEPRLSIQWFLRVNDIAKPALENVMNDNIAFHPKKYKNIFRHWLENIRDWNISRQLFWGHRIPAYYYGNEQHEFVVANTIEEAYELAKIKSENSNLRIEDLRQDEDVLDTWFSSWLWPISVFEGITEPDNEQIEYYYPTNDLVTGPDIIFFWVARMIFSGYEFRNNYPFKNVYFTGLIRDSKGKKFSKSLGNSPDAIKLLDQYSSDGVRVGIMMSSPAGNDLLFDEKLCQQGRNFTIKLWNAYKLVSSWGTVDIEIRDYEKSSLIWFDNKYYFIIEKINKAFDRFKISEALILSYKLIWDDFCSNLLEFCKPKYGEKLSQKAKILVLEHFENLLKIIHPFAPFISEEIWHKITNNDESVTINNESWPKMKDYNNNIIENCEDKMKILSEIRTIRKNNNIPNKTNIDLNIIKSADYNIEFDDILKKMANISELSFIDSKPSNSFSFMIGKNQYFIPFSQEIDIEEEKTKIMSELDYMNNFLISIEKKLSNDNFVSNAPKNIIELELKKKNDSIEKISILKSKLETFI